MFSQFAKIYHEFPRRFWVIVGVAFIDRVGGTLLFPFFSLYITQRFGVGMTEAGLILGLFSVFGLLGGMVGGALTDKFGRRKLILFGLVSSALSTLSLGLVNEFLWLIPLAVAIGLLSDVAGPAHQAMMADVLPEHQRQEGFGIMRVVGNLAWMIGPTIGGFIADKSFFALFVIDAVISCGVAFLFYRLIPETKPAPSEEHAKTSILETFLGYRVVGRDFAFLAFMLACILMGLVYQQMYNTLPVYLRDQHGIPAQGYGALMSTSAVTVILLQFWASRRLKRFPPFLLMAAGTLFYLVGFGMFGLVAHFVLFMTAIIIITIGEIIIMPTVQALAAHFAPAAMRGRYMAVFSLSYFLPATIGPAAAGLILDNADPNLLWYVGAGLCALAALSFVLLHQGLGQQARFAQPAPETAMGSGEPA